MSHELAAGRRGQTDPRSPSLRGHVRSGCPKLGGSGQSYSLQDSGNSFRNKHVPRCTGVCTSRGVCEGGGVGRMGGVSVWACGSSLCDVGFEPPEKGPIHLSIYSSSTSSSLKCLAENWHREVPKKGWGLAVTAHPVTDSLAHTGDHARASARIRSH